MEADAPARAGAPDYLADGRAFLHSRQTAVVLKDATIQHYITRNLLH